ncbi:hypothetical protein [Thioclava sp. F28-4]|uniref:hypothetical protein n=1 Tax=Thioclava sp. F28-4 TaxID=1915315 RepID=UPI0011BADB24|nr:hypothetical protein [Thioclava sp. F28-4]
MITFLRSENFDPDRFVPAGVLENVIAECRKTPIGSSLVIDGWPASGKSPTAIWLSKKLRWPVVHLDDFNFNQRPEFDPEQHSPGFDEAAMKNAVADVLAESSVIVEGVCAGRICEPTIILHLGRWPGERLTKSLMTFIADYFPMQEGSHGTFWASFES